PQARLYQYQVCPFCWKARTALALKGASYDRIEVHPLNKKELGFSDYKKVPVYVDSKGQQVNDSTPIMRHVDAEFGGTPLFETEPAAAARETELIAWSDAYVKAIPPLIYNSFPNALKAFDYITTTSQFSWYQRTLIKYSGAGVMVMVAKKSREKQGIKDPEAHYKKLLQQWTVALEGRDFAGGERPNGADAAVFGITMSMSGLPAARLVRENPAFAAWMLRMERKTSQNFA
ncbi:MAG: glutathione S-transferase N-terminal domain-containing protein, partial [Bdellovibrionota bacterium]